MLSSERSCPGGNSAAEKNRPTLNPIAAMKPGDDQFSPSDAMRQVEPDDQCEAGPDEQAERLAGDDGDR